MRYLKFTPLFILFALAFIQSCKRDPVSMSKEELANQLKKGHTHQKVMEYAVSIGIDTANYNQDKNPLAIFKVLEEIAYGNEPKLAFLQEAMPVDTGMIRAAAEDMVKGNPVSHVMEWLEPSYPDYQKLRYEYIQLKSNGDREKAKQVAESLNAYRWMHRQSQHAPRFVFVNIRGAYLKGIDSTGKVEVQMRTIVGKTDSRTPTMDTYATSIVTNPYWNVPKSIAIREMLPKVLEDEAYLTRNRIQIIDKEGQVVDPSEVKWKKIEKGKDFEYRFRQETGEDNSLGLLKVEIKNPLAIYLHDTNARYLFAGDERWKSHGCVRVQKPADLANFMAGKKMLTDDFFTEPDTTARPPKWNKLENRIPVFLFYLGADVNEKGAIVYFDDIYKQTKDKV